MKFLGALFLSILTSCATLKADLAELKDGAVTCLKNDEPAAKALGLKLVTIAVADLLQGKSPSEAFKDVTAAAEAGAKAQGISVAACAFDDVVADLEKLLHPVVALAPFPDEAQAALATFKAAHGVTSVRH
jgi:hypothetical protein